MKHERKIESGPCLQRETELREYHSHRDDPMWIAALIPVALIVLGLGAIAYKIF